MFELMVWGPTPVCLSGNVLLHLCLPFLITVARFPGLSPQMPFECVWSMRIFLGLPFYHLQKIGNYVGIREKQAILAFPFRIQARLGFSVINSVHPCQTASEVEAHYPLFLCPFKGRILSLSAATYPCFSLPVLFLTFSVIETSRFIIEFFLLKHWEMGDSFFTVGALPGWFAGYGVGVSFCGTWGVVCAVNGSRPTMLRFEFWP